MERNGYEEDGLIRIGELSEQSGVPASTIRYYTELGLLKIGAYTNGGQYLYERKGALEQLDRIMELSKRGMNLKEIRDHLDCARAAKKVLIIDDDEDFARLVTDVLKSAHEDWEIKVSVNVFEAGHTLVEFLPDLAVLDIRLPGVKGYEICKFIRSNPLLKGMKILSVTSYDTPDTRETMFSCGADAYLAKPIDIEEFLKKVEEVFSCVEVRG